MRSYRHDGTFLVNQNLKAISIGKSLIFEEDIKKILCIYYPKIFRDQLNKKFNITLLRCGSSDTYKITYNNQVFMYKIYLHNWKTFENINSAMRMLEYLKISFNSNHYPIKTADDIWITFIKMPEGTRFGVLLNYVKGETLNYSAPLACRVGYQLALLHKSLDLYKQDNPISLLDKNYLIINPSVTIMKVLNKLDIPFENRLQNCVNKLLSFEILDTHYGICHGDAQISNVIISKGNITFIDFELYAHGPCIYDISTFLWKTEILPELEKEKKQIQQALIKGYKEINNLNEKDLKIIQILVGWRHIFWLGMQAELMPNILGHIIFSKEYFNTHLSWLEKWCSRLNEI